MHKIWDLVEEEKPLEDGGFEITPADREFYEDNKDEYEWKKELNDGEPYHYPRYITIDRFKYQCWTFGLS